LEEIFIHLEITAKKQQKKIDDEVLKIIHNAQNTATKILKKHIKLLHLMADKLLKKETIDEKDIKLLTESYQSS